MLDELIKEDDKENVFRQYLLKQIEPFYECKDCFSHYHTYMHIVNMFYRWDKWKDSFLKEFPDLDEHKLLVAIAWHDACYTPGSDTNEELAVDLYKDHCTHYDPEVADAILSTKADNREFKNSLQKVLHDLDWYAFFGEAPLYAAECHIRDEFMDAGVCSKKGFYKGRLEFYKSLDAANIFQTNTMRDLCVDNVEDTVKRRIKELEKLMQPLYLTCASGKVVEISNYDSYTVIYTQKGKFHVQQNMCTYDNGLDWLSATDEEDVCMLANIPLDGNKFRDEYDIKVLKVFTDEEFNQLVKEKILNE